MTSSIFLTIPTRLLEESIKFYTEIFSFKEDERYNRPGGVILVFLSKDGFAIELVFNPRIPLGEPGPFAPLITFNVQSVTEIVSRCASLGVPPPKPMNIPGVTMLRFSDPNGVVISLVEGEL
jgi:catechol 2,3-dioxygenase-like lactoylglutathione lyase family enzyme